MDVSVKQQRVCRWAEDGADGSSSRFIAVVLTRVPFACPSSSSSSTTLHICFFSADEYDFDRKVLSVSCNPTSDCFAAATEDQVFIYSLQ